MFFNRNQSLIEMFSKRQIHIRLLSAWKWKEKLEDQRKGRHKKDGRQGSLKDDEFDDGEVLLIEKADWKGWLE